MSNAKVRSFFLVTISFVYLWAFSSLYLQVPGLYGDNGLMPVRSVLTCESKNTSECIFGGSKPTVLHLFVGSLNFTPFQALETVCLIGILLSILSIIFSQCRDCFVYLSLWYCYFSCFQVGQTFLWFQWDTLLLETGFLTALVAPCLLFRGSKGMLSWLPHDNVTFFLVRWLTFRYIFASGVVKLTAECPTWWGLTALHYHYESQCIPTPAAWYAHQSPDWIKKLSVVGTFAFEIFMPLLFLVPIKMVRYLVFVMQTAFMIVIMITGNYNFFNALTIALCMSFLITSQDSKLAISMPFSNKMPRISFFLRSTFALIITGLVIVWPCIKLFNIRLINWTIESETAFTKEQLYTFLPFVVDLLILVGCLLFAVELVASFLRCIFDTWQYAFSTKMRVCAAWLAVCSVSVLLFTISLVPFSYIDEKSHADTHIWPIARNLHDQLYKYQLVHSYGLFRRMTGVGGRPEVVIQGALNASGPWKEYGFLYKVGDEHRRPPFVVPHQPRLDWQMWFAALGSYQHNDWFISLIWKLLRNENQVLKLLDTNPFPNEPPKYIKADLYLYNFTDFSAKDSKQWWVRRLQSEYMPPISLGDAGVENFLIERRLLIKKPKRPTLGWVTKALRTIRRSSETFDHPQFIWFLTVSVIIFSFVRSYLF